MGAAKTKGREYVTEYIIKKNKTNESTFECVCVSCMYVFHFRIVINVMLNKDANLLSLVLLHVLHGIALCLVCVIDC